MQIILTQPQIEEAIVNHVLSIMTLKDGQSLAIDLRATRGDDGYTAEIRVVSDVSTPGAVAKPAAAPAATVRKTTAAAAPVAETPTTEVTADDTAEAEPAADAAAESSEDTEGKRPSIFSSMKKPTGRVGQEVEAA